MIKKALKMVLFTAYYLIIFYCIFCSVIVVTSSIFAAHYNKDGVSQIVITFSNS